MRLSLIIPSYNGAATLPICLDAVKRSTYKDWDCLVVDDGSTDDTFERTRSFGVPVISTNGRKGAAAARNLGALQARGDILVFVDSDVAIRPDALARIAASFERDPDLDTVMGSYDDAPSAPGFVSQFRNLLHAFVHRQGSQSTGSFWCGCGAVKRATYIEHGGLDESIVGIEDIEFGVRLAKSGRKLRLDPSIQGKHLKAWTLGTFVYTDIFLRGVPWTKLILRSRSLPDELNLKWNQRICALLAGILPISVALASLRAAQQTPDRNMALLSLAVTFASLCIVAAVNRQFYAFLAARRGWAFSLAAVPLHLIYYLNCLASFVLGCGLYFGDSVSAYLARFEAISGGPLSPEKKTLPPRP